MVKLKVNGKDQSLRWRSDQPPLWYLRDVQN